jgi:hypothetical protein
MGTDTSQLKNSLLPWLLEESTPGVRYLAMRELLVLPHDDPDLAAARSKAHSEGPIAAILDHMQPDGYWVDPGPGYSPKYHATVWSLVTLAQLGGEIGEDDRIQVACEYYLDQALTAQGQISASGASSGTADCLQGNMCWAMVALRCEDERLALAFDWMARSVTGEGIAGSGDRRAELRYYASGKCGPGFRCASNNKLPCAWGAVKVMQAFSALPEEHRTPLIRQAIEAGVEFLFSTNPAQAGYPTGYSTKPSGNWWKFGFPLFYVTDLLQVVEVLVNLGLGDDPRLEDAFHVIRAKQDENGRYPLEYSYEGKTWVDFGKKKEPNKWVTLRAQRVLQAVHQQA